MRFSLLVPGTPMGTCGVKERYRLLVVGAARLNVDPTHELSCLDPDMTTIRDLLSINRFKLKLSDSSVYFFLN